MVSIILREIHYQDGKTKLSRIARTCSSIKFRISVILRSFTRGTVLNNFNECNPGMEGFSNSCFMKIIHIFKNL